MLPDLAHKFRDSTPVALAARLVELLEVTCSLGLESQSEDAVRSHRLGRSLTDMVGPGQGVMLAGFDGYNNMTHANLAWEISGCSNNQRSRRTENKSSAGLAGKRTEVDRQRRSSRSGKDDGCSWREVD